MSEQYLINCFNFVTEFRLFEPLAISWAIITVLPWLGFKVKLSPPADITNLLSPRFG